MRRVLLHGIIRINILSIMKEINLLDWNLNQKVLKIYKNRWEKMMITSQTRILMIKIMIKINKNKKLKISSQKLKIT